MGHRMTGLARLGVRSPEAGGPLWRASVRAHHPLMEHAPVALELSRSTWLVALHSPIADKVNQHRLEGGDVSGLLALITRKRGDVERRLRRPVRVVCCF